ncbi:MAG: M48 family metallopeptidase [Planctomycetota bacterium]
MRSCFCALLFCLLSLANADGILAQGFDPQKFSEQFQNNFAPFGNFTNGMSRADRSELEKIPISLREENSFGASVLKGYEQTLKSKNVKITYGGADVEYLTTLVKQFRRHMKHGSRYRSFKVGIVELDETDAYSVPGGTLLFTRGLLESVESEAALAGVVAHEMSHLDRQHQLIGLRQQKRFQKSANFKNMMANIFEIAKPFHAEFESEADVDAVKWLLAEKYDPQELAHLLRRWNNRQDAKQPWLDAMPQFMLTHPDAGKRAADVEQLLRQSRHRGQELQAGIENLKQRIPLAENPNLDR